MSASSGLASLLPLPPALVPHELRSRDYRVLHQKLRLDVDLEDQTMSGYAEMVVLPTTEQRIKFIYVNCKHGQTSGWRDRGAGGTGCRVQAMRVSRARG